MVDFGQILILFMLIGLVVGNPTGSCTFDSDLCGYTPISGQPASWFQISSTTDNHGPPPSNDGHYAYFQSNMIGIKNGETRSLVSPKLNLDGCIDLEFYYILPYSHILTLTIKLQEAGKITLVKNITGMDMKTWQHTKINNICVTKNTQLIFETTKLSYYCYVGIDNIEVTMSTLITESTSTPTKPTTNPPTTKQPTTKPTTKQQRKPTTIPTRKQTTTTTQLPSTTKRSDCVATEVEILWYKKDIERLELEKQKLHLEIKLLKEQLGQN